MGTSVWNVGDQALAIAGVALQWHPTAVIFAPLSTLLVALSSAWPDIEIRDRAHFYRLLLTHVHYAASGKLQAILAPPAPDTEENTLIPASSSLLPLRPLPVTQQGIGAKSLGGHSAQPTCFLSLIRIPKQKAMEKNRERPLQMDAKEDRLLLRRQESVTDVADYLRTIERGDGGWIKYEYALTFTSGAMGALPRPPERIYGVVLALSRSATYQQVSPLRIPYLAAFDPAGGKGTRPEDGSEEVKNPAPPDATAFPYRYVVEIEFRPLAPLPAAFPVSVSYNDPQGRVHQLALPPLRLGFTDLFLPLPANPTRALWSALWKHILSSPYNNPPLFSRDSDPQAYCRDSGRSVKHLPLDDTKIAALRASFSEFIIAGTAFHLSFGRKATYSQSVDKQRTLVRF